MSLENEKKEVEATEDKVVDTKIDAEAIGKTIADAFTASLKAEKEVKTVPDKIIKAHRVEVVGKTQKCGAFKNADEMEIFAKAYLPKHLLEKFSNEKALTTFQNIATDADGGSFDPIDAKGILADSVERFPSYVEDTLQVPIFNSVGTFIDHTSDVTALMVSEGIAGTESKPGNTTRTITQKKIVTLAPITNEVMRFGTLADVTSATLNSMARAISLKKQHLIFIADGTADTNDGSITGVIKAIENVSPNDTVYEVSGASWDNITNTDIAKIVAKTASWADANNFAWYCHKNQWGTLEGLARTLGGNQYLVQVGQRPIPSLFGYPVKFTNLMPSAYQGDKIGLLFGDLSSMVATGSTGQVYVDSSDSFYFSQDTTVLRVIEHIGVNVYQPGTASAASGLIAVKYTPGS